MNTHSRHMTAVIAFIAAMSSSPSQAQLAFPGMTWGSITFPNSVADDAGKERHNAVLDGKLEQGIDWTKFGRDTWTLNTYVSLRYTVDNQGFDYNNKAIPAIGVRIRASSASGIVDVGVQAVQERRWKSDKTSNGAQAYVNWWFGWGNSPQARQN